MIHTDQDLVRGKAAWYSNIFHKKECLDDKNI